MAIRFDNATERIVRTTSVLSFDANYTVMAWVYVVTHNGSGNGACVVSIDDQTDDVDEFYLDAPDGTNLRLGIVTLQGGSAAGSTATATFTAGTWQHVCIVRSANNVRTGYRNGTSEVTHSNSRSGRTAPTAISIGSVLDSDLLNGRIACIKIWNEALTVAEIQQEIGTVRPVRVANLWAWLPGFLHTDTNDYSGNGYNFTAVGTLATEDGPPVSWGARPWVVPWATAASAYDLTAAGIATGAPTLGAPTIAQAHALTAAALTTGAPVLDAPSMGGSAALTATGIATGAPALGTPALGQAHALTAAAITTGAPTLGAPTIGQAHALTATGIATAAPALGTPRLLPHLGATIGGVLTAASNGRYFRNNAGPLMLAGFHTWYNLVNGGASTPPPTFGWSTYLSALTSYGVNSVRLWMLETTRDWPSDNTQRFEMTPWLRTGPGTAADGGLKFDLTQFNPDFFERLRTRCIELGNAGVYASIMLFNGFHVDNTKEGGATGDPWAYHPFKSTNNINSISGDIDGDGIGDDARSTTNTAAYNAQKAYIEHVIDTVNDLDNVLYEIENEGGTYSETWQKALIDYIHTYEAGKAKQHPVGMTKIYPSGTNTMLTGSNAEWISPDEDLTPAAQNSTAKRWIYDTDHAVGITTDRKWAWIALTQGYGGLWYMDLWDSGAGGAADTISDATYMQIRRTLGWALDYAARMDLDNATPQGSISSTGYALAKTMGGAQILAYQSGSGAFTVDLTGISGTFSLEWQRVANSAGTIQAGSNVSGGAVRTLTPPWAGEDVVAFLQLTQNDLTAANITTGAPSVGTPTPGQTHALSAAGIATGAPSVAAPTLAQIHPLAATGITTDAPTLGTPTIAQVHVLAAVAITTATPTLGTPSMSGESALTAIDITAGAPALGTPTLAQVHILSAATIVAGAPALDAPAIGQTHALSAPGIATGAPVLGTPSMTGEAALEAAGITAGAASVGAPAIGQVQGLAAGGIATGAASVGAPAIGQIHILTAVLIVAGAPTLGAPSMDRAVMPVPAERTYVVAWEDRTYTVGAENRTYTVTGE